MSGCGLAPSQTCANLSKQGASFDGRVLTSRTLGQKIVMEDEMDRGDVLRTPGGDVKRMTPKSALRR